MIELFVDLGKSALHPQSSKLMISIVATWVNVSIAVSDKATRYQAGFIATTNACSQVGLKLGFKFKLLSSLA